MIWSRWDWLIPVWTMSMSKRPSSPATRRIQYSVIRPARSPAPLPDEVASEDVLRHIPVPLRLRVVDERENDIEPREERWCQVQLLGYELRFIEAAELRIRRGEDSAPRLEDGGDARLRYADS